MSTIKKIVWCFVLFALCNVASAVEQIEGVTLEELKKPTKNSDADAEVLKKVVHYELDELYQQTLTTYVAVKLNNSVAVSDYSQQAIKFDGFYEDAELLFANTIDLSGKKTPLDRSSLQTQTPPSRYFYKDDKHLVFSMPALKEGSVVEYSYRIKSKKVRIPNYWGASLFFYHWHRVQDARAYRLDPVRYSEYKIIAPSSISLNISNYNGAKKFKKTVKKRDGKKVYRWYARNIDKIELQSGMPHVSQFLPHVSVTTLDDWRSIDSWAYGLFESQQEVTQKIRDIADSIVDMDDATLTKKQKIDAVYNYINTNVRYVYSHVGRGGYTPHEPEHILGNGFGDCKDQTMLAVTLLNQLGVKAYPALISTVQNGDFDKNKNIPNFDHMIVYIPDSDLQLNWMDTTSDKALSPGISSGLQGLDALVLGLKEGSSGGNFVQLPDSNIDTNKLSLSIAFDKINKEKVTANFRFDFKGSFEERFRNGWRNVNKEAERQYIQSTLGKLYPNAIFQNIQSHNKDDLHKPFYISGQIGFDTIWSGTPSSFSSSISSPFLWQVLLFPNGFVDPETRVVPFRIYNDYSFDIHYSVAKPDVGYYPEVQALGTNFDNQYIKVEQAHEKLDDRVDITLSSQFYKGYFDVKAYKELMKEYAKYLNSGGWTVKYSYHETKQKEAALQEEGESLESIKSLIQLYIDNGEFEKGLALADTMLKRDDVDGHAYYLLGLLHAYLGNAESSNESFDKAKEKNYAF